MDQTSTMTQLALAMGAGWASYLSKRENGHCTNPGRTFLGRYASAYAILGRPLSDAQRALLASVVLALPDAA